MKFTTLIALIASVSAINLSEEPVAAAPAAAPADPAPAAAKGGAKAGTPADSYKQKADSLKAVNAAVAEQERFQAEHNKMVADNFAADDAAAKAERARVSRARQTQLQGGLAY